MAHIPVVLGLTALVAVPTAVGVHFLSTSGKTQTQETTEQQPEEREVGQQQDLSLTSETQNDDFADVDRIADDVEEEVEIALPAGRPQEPSTSQPEKQQDSEHPKLTNQQLRLPVLKENLMGAAERQVGSIGPKFKNYLLSDTQDETWRDRTKLWAKKFMDDGQKNSLTSIFVTQMPIPPGRTAWSWISVSSLQSRCKQAYGRITWDSPKAGVDRNAYWNTVKELCGKTGASFSSEWNPAQ